MKILSALMAAVLAGCATEQELIDDGRPPKIEF
jgi:hypothetical protein